MTIQITIIGLGQIGASIGLALAEQGKTFQRVGHDREIEIARMAKKQGAVDRFEINLPKSVKDADLVLLSLPIDQIQQTMTLISQDLKEDAVVMDTGPLKEIVAAWAAEYLPSGRHYVGLTPVINPDYLHEADSGIQAAHPDLFRRGLIAIVTPTNTNSEAIKMAADLTRLLGAMPLFVDPVEVDGLMAATHLLPQLLSASLLNATIDQPGWREARKFAGRAYAEATGPIVHMGDSKTLQTSVLLNRENILRVLDGAISALKNLRSDIEAQDDDALGERLMRARVGREIWWQERQSGNWTGNGIPSIDIPETPGIFGKMFGIKRGQKPKN